MWSARVGCVQAARILLESGASVSATNEFGATALHEAVDSGSQEVAALLVERGADPNVQDGRGNTPLMLAARCGHGNADVSASVVRTLMESDTAVGLEVTNNDGQTALTWAVVNGHIKLVRLLMQQGSDPMTIDNDGRGILAVTAGTGQENLMKAMLESVLTANSPEEITKSNQKAARMFSLQDNSGNTPLIAAARHSGARGGDPSEAESASLDCCKVVCSYEGGRETIDMQNHDGDTALIGAVRADRATVVAFLIEQGADRAVENNWGMTAEFLVSITACQRLFFSPGCVCLTPIALRHRRMRWATKPASKSSRRRRPSAALAQIPLPPRKGRTRRRRRQGRGRPRSRRRRRLRLRSQRPSPRRPRAEGVWGSWAR